MRGIFNHFKYHAERLQNRQRFFTSFAEYVGRVMKKPVKSCEELRQEYPEHTKKSKYSSVLDANTCKQIKKNNKKFAIKDLPEKWPPYFEV